MATAASSHDLTANEVAVLSDVPPRAVRKALEERILAARPARLPALNRTVRQALPADAVSYMALMREIDWPVPVEGKRRIARWLRGRRSSELGGRIALHGPLALDLSHVAGKIRRASQRAERYRRARARWIVSDPGILGGTPVIRGTRISVYAVLGRVDGGETLADIVADYPGLPSAAFAAALLFARANPLRGRPSGRPWRAAA